MTKSSTDMIPSETLQRKSPTRYSVDDNCSEVMLLQTKLSTSNDVLVNNETINKHDMTNEVNKSYTNQKESRPTSIANAYVMPIPSCSVCSKEVNNVERDYSLPDKTFQFNSISNKNEMSPVYTKNRSSITPSPLVSITMTMKLSCLASINDDRGTSTSKNNSKHSPREVKPNTANQPSNTYYPFHSPFHTLPLSSTNGITDQIVQFSQPILISSRTIPLSTPTSPN